MSDSKPKLAVYKFASCDGCQLSLLDCEDELLGLVEVVQLANFPEASRAVAPPPYDIALVEGSITTPHDAKRIRQLRDDATVLITIGACATAGGIQALRNYRDVREMVRAVYARPGYIDTLATSTPIAAHVEVDFQLQGCPVNKHQLLEVLNAFLNGRPPNIAAHPVCVECKQRGNPCVVVADGKPCLGPVTHAGCNALCPSYDRGCFGCYGPSDAPRTDALVKALRDRSVPDPELARLFSTFNAASPAFRSAAQLVQLRRPSEKSS